MIFHRSWLSLAKLHLCTLLNAPLTPSLPIALRHSFPTDKPHQALIMPQSHATRHPCPHHTAELCYTASMPASCRKAMLHSTLPASYRRARLLSIHARIIPHCDDPVFMPCTMSHSHASQSLIIDDIGHALSSEIDLSNLVYRLVDVMLMDVARSLPLSRCN